MEYIKDLHAFDGGYETPVFINIGVQNTAMAILDGESENTRALFFDLSEAVSIPTAVFVSESSGYFFGSSAILAAEGGYEGKLFTHFADDLSLIDKDAVSEMGTTHLDLTNKTLLDAFLGHIITLLKTPELCVINRIQSIQSLHLFVTVGHIFDKSNSFYYFHSVFSQNKKNGIKISFTDVKNSLSALSEADSVVGVNVGKLMQTDIKASSSECFGELFSVKLVIKTFLQYVYKERNGKAPASIESYDLLTLDALIEKLEGLAAKQTGRVKRITVLADGEEAILSLRQSDKDYFDLQMPISLGDICVNGFVQARSTVYSYIGRALMSQNRVIIVPDEYAAVFRVQDRHFQNLDIYFESDVLSLMAAEYLREKQILKNAIASVEKFRKDIYSPLTDYYQCEKAFSGCSGGIKSDIIIPAVRAWGTQPADQSLRQLSSNIDHEVRTYFYHSINGGKIEAVILRLKKDRKIYDIAEKITDSCFASVFGSQKNYPKELGDIFSVTDSYFEAWKSAIPRSRSIMSCLVSAKGFFDFFSDESPINISKRAAISNRFISSIDIYCQSYFESFDTEMYGELSKQVFMPLVTALGDYLTEQYKRCLESLIARDGNYVHTEPTKPKAKKNSKSHKKSIKNNVSASDTKQKAIKVCPQCGAEVKDKFCGMCGMKYVSPAAAKPTPTKKCSNCGAEVKDKFCGKCGTKY